MNTALANIIAKVLWATDWVLDQFFTVTAATGVNVTNDVCTNQVNITPTACGTMLLQSLANLVFGLGNLGGEIFTALGVANPVG